MPPAPRGRPRRRRIYRKQVGGGDIDVSDRIDPAMRDELLQLKCGEIESYKGNRIGSKSMHAEVYDTPSASMILKLCPYTKASMNEVARLREYMTDVLRTSIHHFPICYRVMTCQDIHFEDPTLTLNSFDDLIQANAGPCLDYMRRAVAATLPGSKPNRALEVLKRGLAAPAPLELGKVQRFWKLFKQAAPSSSGAADNTVSVAIFAERATTDLRLLLQQTPKTPVELAKILYQVCAALRIMRAKNHKHGDLHAGNVLIVEIKPGSVDVVYPEGDRVLDVRDYVILWDFETVAPATAEETVVEDAKRLFTSMAPDAAIQQRQPPETMALIQSLETRPWDSLEKIMGYLKRIIIPKNPDARVSASPRSRS